MARAAVLSLLAAQSLGTGPASAVGQGLPPAKDRWIRLRLEHLTLLGNVPERELREAAARLLELEAVVGTVLGAAPEGRLPTRIFLFKNDRALRPYLPEDASGSRVKGIYVSGKDGGFAAVAGNPTDGKNESLLHEWVHHLLAQTPPRLPLWLDEGLAELFSGFVSTPPTASVGRAKGQHINLLRREGLLPVETLLEIDSASSHYRGDPHSGRFYAQSWLLVHFVLSGARGLEGLADMVEGFRAHGDAAASLGVDDLAELNRSLERYLWGQVFPTRIVSPAGRLAAEAPTAVALSRRELLAELGDLLIHLVPPRLEAARRHFEAALGGEPGLALAHRGLGYLHELAGDLSGATTEYRTALSLDPQDLVTSYRLGHATVRYLSDHYPSPGTLAPEDVELLAEARAALSKVVVSWPRHAPSLAELGTTYLFDSEPLEEGLAILQRAAAMSPERADVSYARIVLLARLQRFSEGGSLLGELAQRQAVDDNAGRLLEGALRALNQAQLAAGSLALNRDRLEDAESHAAAILARIEGRAALEREFQPRAEELLRLAAFNRGIEQLNRCVMLAGAGRLDEALGIIDEMIETSEDPRLLRRAEDVKRRLEAKRPR